MISKVKSKATTSSSRTEKENIFWYHSLDSDPPQNFTPGLIPVLKQALQRSHAKGQTVRAALCYERAVHVSIEPWDSRWGCGYRNFLMACAALIDQQIQPEYFPALNHPTPPGVRNLQKWIEEAWNKGFDEEGAKDLKYNLAGTRKWIGTAELYVAFVSRGIPCQLVDFPDVNDDANSVLTWIESYFTSSSPGNNHTSQAFQKSKVQTTVGEALRGASPVVITNRMPIILQHDGHSRTIIGYERLKSGSINLLCFDPSRFPKKEIRSAAKAFYFAGISKNPVAEKESDTNTSPSKVPKLLNKLFHPRSLKEEREDGRKRRASTTNEERDMKRQRGRSFIHNETNDAGVEVIEILDDHDENVEHNNTTPKKSDVSLTTIPEVNYNTVLEFFRLRSRKVGQKDQYQILYFPLDDLLTEQERWNHKVVSSEVIR